MANFKFLDVFDNSSLVNGEGGFLSSANVDRQINNFLGLDEITSVNKIQPSFSISQKPAALNFQPPQSNDSYMSIAVIEKKQSQSVSTAPKEAKTSTNIKTKETDIIRLNIRLPMAQALQSTSANTWSGAETNSIGSSVLEAITSKKSIKDTASDIKERAGKAAESAATGTLLGKSAENLRSFNTQSVANNGRMMLFTGTEYRTFSFMHSFSPKNEQESIEVMALIKGLKYWSAPKYGSAVLTYPSLFNIKFSKDFGLKLAPCALTNITVNYSPENIWAAHTNGAPIHITLSTTFQETELIFQDSIADGKWY